MSFLKINPKKLNGEVKIPPSKSMAHRAIICAALSNGVSNITNVDFSEDIIATIKAMEALGTVIEVEDNSLKVDGRNTFKNNGGVIDCNESGSTLRFLVPISIVKENKINFIGRGNLGKRPLDTYYKIFNDIGVRYSFNNEKLNLFIDGKLTSGDFCMKGNISSQFISGLLFALPLLDGESKIIITTEIESKGYIDLTISMLNTFGIDIKNNNYKEFIIKGNQRYISRDYEVEGDYSQAAFFLCAGAIGSDIKCLGLDDNSLQGDKEILSILEQFGAKVVKEGNGLKVIGNKLKASIIDGSQCPDIIPVVSVVAALSEGTTTINNIGRLRIKECDRLAAISKELNKIGANVEELEDGLIIHGVNRFKGGNVESFDDHRIAMALAIASTKCIEPLILKNPYCIKKSYPGFFNDFKYLGGDLNEWNVGK